MLKVHDAHLICSAVKSEQYPECDANEVVILGRSNVGKSTFINKLANRKKLAYTSSKPGKTQVLNFFKLTDQYTLVDVPGYGYAKVSQKMREQFGQMIEQYLTTRACISFAILLVDFKVGPTEDDVLMYNFLKYYEIDVVVIATKRDKVKNSQASKQRKKVIEKLQLDESDKLIIYSSEINGDMQQIYNLFKDE